MFGSKLAQVIWTLVPVISFSLLAAVPFVVAAVKGVVKPWLAVVYVAAELLVLTVTTALSGNDPQNWSGFLLIVLMIVSATHTALLDSARVRIGK